MKNYALLTGIISIAIIGLCGMVNYIVDPFVIYRLNIADTARLSRIEQFPNMRLYKPLQVNQIKPDALVIGSSRAGGIRPADAGWDKKSSYNFSIPGITLYELKRSIEHAHAIKPLKKLMIGLDFSAFIVPTPLFRFGFQENRLASRARDLTSPAYLKQKMSDWQSTLFTLDALGESIEATTQTQPKIRQYSLDGSWRGLTTRLTGRGGYIFVAQTSVAAKGELTFQADDNLSIFRELLQFCYQNNIETKLFFTPTHVFFVDLWQTRATTGLWRKVHRDIIDINTRMADKNKVPPYEIWGFGQAKGIVDEPVYLAKNTPKAWFNDGVHFRPKLSRKIMTAMWSERPTFGTKLTPVTIGVYLREVNSLKSAFLRANQKMVSSLHEKISR